MKTPPQLSFLMLIALVIGNMIGAGIYTLPASLAPYGGMAILGWMFTTLGALLLALMFANLSRTLVKSGGPYAYCHAAFGDFIGFLVAYNYWVAMWVANAAVAVSLVAYLGIFFPRLDEHALVYSPWVSFAVKVFVIWVITGINGLGVRKAGEMQVITLILKLLPLLIVIGFGLPLVDIHQVFQLPLAGGDKTTLISSLTHAATLTLWAFIGLEAATIPSESALDIRDVAKATVWGTFIAALIYILSTVVVMGIIAPTELGHLSAPFSEVATRLFGAKFAFVIGISAIFSCLGCLNGWTLMLGQIPMAAARDGLFPSLFAKQNRQGVPMQGLVVSSGLVTVLLLLTTHQKLVSQFTLITLLATLAFLVPYFITAMADLILLRKNPEHLNPRRLRQSVVIAALAGLYAFWTIAGSGSEIVFYGILLILSSVPVYVFLLWRRKSLFKISTMPVKNP